MTKDFNVRHPDYVRMVDRWTMAWDFWRGGIHVRRPASAMTDIRWAVGKPEPVTDEDYRLSSYDWYNTRANSYLWKNDRESLRNYEDRGPIRW